MNLSVLLTYVIVSSITPGPNNIMSMYICSTHGLWNGRRFICGAACGFTVLFMLCAVLNYTLSAFIPVVEPYMKWLGVAYLVFLAAMILFGSKKDKDNTAKLDRANSVVAGFLLQYVNVKGILFGITVFAMYVTPYTATIWPAFGFALLFGVIGLASLVLWGAGGVALRRVFARYGTAFNIVMAALLLYCAYTAIR